EARALAEKLQTALEQLRRTTYAAHMNLAKHSWETGSIAHVRELLEKYRPKAGETDLRGFEWYYLNRLCHAEILTVQGFAVFSPDGKRLASAGGGPGIPPGTGPGIPPEVKVRDAQTGQVLLSIKGAGVP